MCNIFDVCLIGLGPAGIGFLSSIDTPKMNNIICFEKGTVTSLCNCHISKESICTHCNPCHIISGLGGAARFSCGKISAYPAGSGLIQFFDSNDSLELFMKDKLELLSTELNLKKFVVPQTVQINMKDYFNNNGILYKYYDVYEFENKAYYSYINKIISNAKRNGVQLFFETEVTKITKENYNDNSVFVINTKSNNQECSYYARKLVFATGNIYQSVDTIEVLTEKKSNFFYELGVRISVPTEKLIPYLNAHGDLKLKYKMGRTYCVSKNGHIIAYSVNDSIFLEGYVDVLQPTKVSNFAVIFKDNNLSELNKFKKLYNTIFDGVPIQQKYSDYINKECSVLDFNQPFLSVQNGDINMIFSKDFNQMLIEFIDSVLIKSLCLSIDDITLFAPELKESYSFDVNKNFQITKDIYIIGASTGKFRGILQSMSSGILCGKRIRG